ncbi:ABC-type multidrug transport system, ATPase component [Lachnospiraceae bacterium KM106-2]|nr:ABC-type multidrug transport system, ATPase component [Lachnospiraceae bacterium KM106-2]
MDTILEVKDLNKDYGKKRVLSSVNISLKKGQIYGLVGKNGAGKTTLMRVVCGLAFQTSGEVALFGETGSKELDAGRQKTGTIIETPTFFPFMTAKKNLEYFRIQRGIKNPEVVDEILEVVGLADTGNKKFKNFSLGMKQRLGLGLALMNQPEFLILDEPINGLDPEGIVEIRNLILKLNKERNITIMISSHILSELSAIATDYGFMKDGQVVEQLSAKELEDKCTNYIELKVSDTEKAAALIKEKLQCGKCEIVSENEIRIFNFEGEPSDISELIVMNGIKLSLLDVQATNLENYFLELLGGDHQ